MGGNEIVKVLGRSAGYIEPFHCDATNALE